MQLSALGGAPEAPAGSVAAPPIDLTDGSVAHVSFAEMEIIDTRTFPTQIDVTPGDGKRRVKEVLPPHTRPAKIKPDVPGEVVGAVLEEARATPDTLFPGIGATPWTPPASPGSTSWATSCRRWTRTTVLPPQGSSRTR